MSDYLARVRKAALPGIWSKGVEWARSGLVVLEADKKDEAILRVRAPDSVVPPTVTLFLADDEWSCDCPSKVDPCAHVVAAAIARSQPAATQPAATQSAATQSAATQRTGVATDRGASPDGAIAPSAPNALLAEATSSRATDRNALSASAAARVGEIHYDLIVQRGSLVVRRVIVHADGRREVLAGALASFLVKSPRAVIPSHDDLAVDRMALHATGGVITPVRVGELFGRLEAIRHVTFEGKPCRISKEEVRPRAVVLDGKDGGVLLRLERDPALDQVVARGIGQVGDVLRPLADTDRTGDQLERLPMERLFARGALGELVTRVLPDLEQRIEVDVRTTRLPGRSRTMPPRVEIELDVIDGSLSAMPRIVYGDPPIARVDGDELQIFGDTAPVRNVSKERVLISRLRDELDLAPGRRTSARGEDASRLLSKIRAFRTDAKEGTLGEVFAARRVLPQMIVEDDRFDVTFSAVSSDEPNAPPRAATLESVLGAWQAGFDFVPLDGGGFAPLPVDWLSRFGDRIASLLAARDAEGRVARAVLPRLGELCDELGVDKPAAIERLRPLAEGFSGLPKATMPEDLTVTLRDYQEEGVRWLTFLRDNELGGILADDMGLGKTLQAATILRGRALVVCPKSVLFHWEGELRRFRPSLRIARFHGPDRKLDPRADVTLTTYSMLRIDEARLKEIAWDAIVLDEAQTIKNPDSQAARAAYALRAPFRLALSGTPVENRLEELFALMHFVNPGLLGTRAHFRTRFSEPIERGDDAAAERLRATIRPFVLRRKKRDVAPELPPRTEQTLFIELEEDERKVYDAVRAATRKDVLARLSEGASIMAVLEALLRLRQAACHPALVPGQHGETSSKVEALVEALGDAASAGHRALVFSQWTSFLDRIEPALSGAGIAFDRLDGSTKDREGVVRRFQSDDGTPVLLLSLKAGGTGLNLTAADHVFILDPWWNPAAEDQAADRAHRIGQDKPVSVFRLVAKDTVEERILALQERKRKIADVALEGADQGGGITREDLLALLEG